MVWMSRLSQDRVRDKEIHLGPVSSSFMCRARWPFRRPMRCGPELRVHVRMHYLRCCRLVTVDVA